MPKLSETPIHLGRGGTAMVEPPMTGIEWYAAYSDRHAVDGADGRLVSQFAFSESWDSWEMHPAGDEVVLCIAGGCTLIQERADGGVDRTTLAAGDYAVNPPGVWHTAEIAPGGHAVCVFITPGEGTAHRPR